MSGRGCKSPVPLAPEAARERAIRTLGRREHSARELTAKLARDGLAREVAHEVVDELSEAGWQSDERYAGLLTRSRIAQGYGPLRIRAELSARGVADPLIAAALDEADPEWGEVINRLYQRRYPGQAADSRETATRYRFLAMRGFTSSQIRSVMRNADVDELDPDG